MKITNVNEPPVEQKNEAEIRLIKLPAGYGCEELWYGETPVTEGQWQEVMGGEIARGANYPKVNVSFNDAEDFCRKLTELSGENFRLPTELEQCRAFGTEPDDLSKFAVFDENNCPEVKTKSPNEYGLSDVPGLVWEWAESGEKGKSLRGGSWRSFSNYCRSAFRGYHDPGYRGNDIGFRVVVAAGTLTR